MCMSKSFMEQGNYCMKKNKVFDYLRYLEKRTFKGHAGDKTSKVK